MSAIVPATDSPATLQECLRGIADAEQPPDEVITVDGGGARGPADARNAGAARASGQILVFVDADVVPHPDAFARIRAAFAADPSLAAVFGAYDDQPPARDFVSSFRNLLHHHVHSSSAGEASTFWAGLGAVRRDVFESLGGFDAARFHRASVEDVELGLRLIAAGHRVTLDPGVRGTHLKRWTLLRMLRADAVDRAFPWTRLLLERGGSRALNLSWRHRVSAAAAVAAATAAGLRRPAVAVAAGVALVALNSSFYRLLLERRGRGAAVAGVGLHVAHHIAATVGAAAAIAAHVLHRGRPG